MTYPKSKIVVNLRQLRLEYQVKVGHSVSIDGAARSIGIDPKSLTRLENNKNKGISFDLLALVCDFYDIEPGDVLKRSQLKDEAVEKPGVMQHA